MPLTLELEEQGSKGDIKPNGAIDYGIRGVRGKTDIQPIGAIDFESEGARDEGLGW